MKKLVIISAIPMLLFTGAWNSLFAQDVHFTQTNMIPVQLNPALTGISEGTHRIFLNYKNQWRGMAAQGAAFNTSLFSYDAALFKNKWHRGWLGAGLLGYKDVAGDLKMGTTQLSISIAGIVYINEEQFISGGLQGGYVQKSLSTSAMLWGSQIDQSTGTFNTALPSNDVATITPSIYGNLSTGLSWNYIADPSTLSANDELKINIGIAAHNVSTPKQNFNAYGSDNLYRKFVIHGTSIIGIRNSNLALMPNAAFYMQGPSQELNVGALVRWTIKDKSRYTNVHKGAAFALGAQYRWRDALCPVMLIEYSNYAIGISYDLNASGLAAATGGKGGVEFSLKFVTPIALSSSILRVRDE
ncbi:MAG: PorP/SprF family type IX secretion system membrane protein [Bacteroidota bacterium]